jgi:hypothetical protein
MWRQTRMPLRRAIGCCATKKKTLKTKGENSSMLLQKYSGKHYAGDEL